VLISFLVGIPRDCSEAEIKKGYRRESLKHHPDKVSFCHLFLGLSTETRLDQGGDEEKFKLVVEAHNVLSDPRRRERYDLGEDEDGMTDSGHGMGGMGGMDLSELFAQFHGGGGGGFSTSSFGGGARSHTHGFSF